MSRYDGLIIPRSYSEYINKTDAATLSQALQLNNALDDTPTEDSRGGVRSGGVYDALAGKQPTLTFDDTPTDGSNNPVKSGGVYDALAGKQPTLTFDDTPTDGSNNPVKSGGIYETMRQVDRLTITVTTPFGTIHALQNGKVIQVSMNGTTGITIPPGTELATLPKPSEALFIPVIKYTTQTVIGLIQLNTNGKLIAYSGNTQNLETAVYSFTYVAA